MAIGAVVLIPLGIRSPTFTEFFAYVVSIFIMLQSLWDLAVFDWNMQRTILISLAVTTFIVNVISGKVRFIGARRTAKRAIGLGR